MNKKINKIIFILSLISIICFGVCLLIFIHVHWYKIIGLVFEILTIISAGFMIIIGIISGLIFILINWNNIYLNKPQNKLLWGILAIFPLFTIASLIFSCIISNVYSNNNIEYLYKNLIKNKQCRTTYEILIELNKLYKSGIINKEEYNEHKEKILGKS